MRNHRGNILEKVGLKVEVVEKEICRLKIKSQNPKFLIDQKVRKCYRMKLI